MTARPLIIIVENAVDVTGSLVSSIRTANLLRETFNFLFVLPSGSKAGQLVRTNGHQVKEIAMKELSRNPWANLKYVFSLSINTITFRRFLRKSKPVLIVNNDFYNLLPVAYRGLGGKVPYICFVRFLPNRFPKLLVRIWYSSHLRYASKIVAVSQAVYNQLPFDDKLTVVYNELPVKTVELSAPSGHLILCPGNYITGKGHNFALEAFNNVAQRYPEWRLRFVGGDMGLEKNRLYKSKLQKSAQDLGLLDRIEFLSFSSNLGEHYLEAALVLNFSESESFSLTTLEAQFYGRPVIATRCGGPEEIVSDGETGILVPVRDVEAMTKAIERLISSSELREKMGKSGYSHVREKFSHENTIEKLAEIFHSAIKK
ncbi:MAG: glycosyltransferase [Chryseolinea sp.]